jgi:small-conductance mechanosensitive channel
MMVCAVPLWSSAQTDSNFQVRAHTQALLLSEQASALVERKSDFSPIRQILIGQKGEAETLIADIDIAIASVTEDLNRLGEPLSGEAPRVTSQRTELTVQLEELKKSRTQAEDNLSEAERLEAQISSIKRDHFYSELADRTPSLVLASLWQKAGRTSAIGYVRYKQSIADWFQQEQAANLNWMTGLSLFGALLAAGILTLPVRHWLDHRIIRPLGVAGQDASLGVLISLLRAGLRALPSLLVIFVLHQALSVLGFFPPVHATLVQAITLTLVYLVLTESVCAIFLSHVRPVLPLEIRESGLSSRLRTFFLAIASILAIDQVLREGEALFGSSDALDQVQRGLVALLLSGVIFALSRRFSWSTQARSPEKPDPASRFGFLRTLLTASGVLIGLSALVGYVNLAHFAATRIVVIGGLVLLLMLVRSLVHQLSDWLAEKFLKSNSDHDGQQLELVQFWLGILSDLCVLAAGFPALLLIIGLEWGDISRLISTAVTGFTIGSLKISLVQIAFAILVFAMLMTLTRFVQRTTERRVFSHMRMDIGVQNSLKTLIGYVGLVIAFLTGVSMLGLNLSNLAIIAGALSVGIGFGLQSIVNNFVSGLILLFERPIKVGDWVVTASGEGIVKKISVRSTEIETFDRSSVLVPNSELISSSVVNWTHKNKLGRVIVPVGVAYKEDPEAIVQLLMKAVKSADLVLANPEPAVIFTGFGESSLDFEVRAFIGDIHNSLKVRSNLRIKIFQIFREAGVEIPFPQRDLHIRDINGQVQDALPTEKPDGEKR